LFSHSEAQITNNYLPKLNEFLKVRGLKISKQKSKIINLQNESLNYLGWKINLVPRNLKHNKTGLNKLVLLVKPSFKSIRRVKLKIKSYFKLRVPIGVLIARLNPIIRG
jgi:hypothetical protein